MSRSYLASLRAPVSLGLFALLAAVLLAACSGGGEAATETPEVRIETPTPAPTEATPSATSTPRRTPTPTPTEAPTETATATSNVPVVNSLGELVEEYGYPSDATFARLRIPTLGVDAAVSARVAGSDGVMPNPSGPADVVWYDLSAWPGLGGAPGEGGNAIFSGHVDYNAMVPYAGVHYRGQGVFSQLSALSNGDIVEVEYNGQTLQYAVVSKQQLGAEGTNWAAVWSSAGADAVTLYTCGGDFDFTSRSYSDRVVVRAERIN